MARFNKAVKNPTRVMNYEGGEAYKPTDKLELILRTMSFLMSGDAYYTKEKDTAKEIQNLVKRISTKDPKFVLNLAAYARKYMYLRTVPMYLLVEYAKAGTRTKGAYKYVPQILRRADEPSEALAYYMESTGSRKIPAMLKKGIGDALNLFDEYQFAKYNREGKVTLKDAVFLCHPKAVSQEQQVLFDKIVKDELKTPETWETYISAHGSTKENWEKIIPKMGYMAILRNLRNFEKVGVASNEVVNFLTNPSAVIKSKQFPYRFLSAYRELSTTKYLDAVNEAMQLSVRNIPKIPGKTFIASDNSGSMHMSTSGKSKVQNIEVAALFSAISLDVCQESKVGVFGQDYADVPLSRKSTILDNMDKIKGKYVGHSTEAWKALEYITNKGEFYDRIFIFSDMQCYTGAFFSSKDMRSYLNKYREKVNPKCRMYSFDIAQYGLLKFPENDPLTCPIAGYSDQIFRFVPLFEGSRETMVKTIESYNPFAEG